jgi:hypothetical protein
MSTNGPTGRHGGVPGRGERCNTRALRACWSLIGGPVRSDLRSKLPDPSCRHSAGGLHCARNGAGPAAQDQVLRLPGSHLCVAASLGSSRRERWTLPSCAPVTRYRTDRSTLHTHNAGASTAPPMCRPSCRPTSPHSGRHRRPSTHAPGATSTRISAQRLCPDTEEVTGSNPVSPTSVIPSQRYFAENSSWRRAGYGQIRGRKNLLGFAHSGPGPSACTSSRGGWRRSCDARGRAV